MKALKEKRQLYYQYRMDLQSSAQVQKYLKKKGLVILPVGCLEMHGPEIPLGCDAFHAWAQAILLAEVWQALVLPPVYFTFPGASGPWPGTVDISLSASEEYLTEIVLSLIKGNFKQIVLCGTHGPLNIMLSNVIRTVFQQTRVIVGHLQPDLMPKEQMLKELGYPRGEDILVLASLKILGWGGVYHPGVKEEKPMEFPFSTIGELKKQNISLPWTFSRDYQHTGLRPQVKAEHVDRAIQIMKKAARKYKEFPTVFKKYQKEIKELFIKQPWRKENIWTLTK